MSHKYNGMEELYKLIPDEYADVIATRLFSDRLNELRIRNGFPVRVCYDGLYRFLGKNGLCQSAGEAFTASAHAAEEVIMRACEHSLYTVTDTLKKGYVSARGGIRIGVCGNAVMHGGEILTVKNFSSVNIRLPHQVKGCADGLFPRIATADGIKNTLIISPPGGGKTTVIRELCRLLSEHGYNVLLCDEKYEIACATDGAPMLDVGSSDVMSGADKRRVFEAGVAYMRPDVIVADELFPSDVQTVARAVHCGIAVIATAHARDYADFAKKPEFSEAIENRVFDMFATVFPPPNRRIAVKEAEIDG